MVQVELGEDLERRLEEAARELGLTAGEYLRRRLAVEFRERDELGLVEEHHKALARLSSFTDRWGSTLGGSLSLRDLISEGRE